MTNEEWPQEIVNFYESLSIDEHRREDLLNVHDTIQETRKWKWIAGILAVCCTTMMVVFGTFFWFGRDVTKREEKNNIVQEHQPVNYDLVAVKMYNNGCGKCRAMSKVFAELQHDLEGKRILFLTFDVTDSTTHGQSSLLIDTLGFDESLNDIETGTIVLLDRRGRFLKKLDGAANKQFLADQIAMRL